MTNQTKDRPETAVAIREDKAASALVPQTLQQAAGLADRLAKSALIPSTLRNKPEDVLVILMKGSELGLAPMQALSSIHVISGKAVCEAALMVGLCLSRRDVCAYFTLVESDARHATYETLRHGAPDPVRLTYTIEEAKAAGLTNKDNWKNHAAAMLRARASGALARAVYPDLVAGIYTPDEADEFRERSASPAPRAIRQPRPIAPAPAPAPPVEVVDVQTGEVTEAPAQDEPGASDGPDLELTGDVPTHTGSVESVIRKDGEARGRKWTRYDVRLADGESFGTFDSKIADFAGDMLKKGTAVRIVYSTTERGGKRIEEIAGAF